MKLIIGNKNYSSWSLRPWLLLRHFDLDFLEVKESLSPDNLGERLAQYSPSRRVPVLIDDEVTVWDSLAICEYVSEKFLEGAGWPRDRPARATVRAICHEIHGGFSALRSEMPMNIRARRQLTLSSAAKQDIARIDEMWSHQIMAFEGPWLFGEFSIADCMYAPVVLRFQTYNVTLNSRAQKYMSAIGNHPGVRAWVAAASQETEIVEDDEAGVDIDA